MRRRGANSESLPSTGEAAPSSSTPSVQRGKDGFAVLLNDLGKGTSS